MLYPHAFPPGRDPLHTDARTHAQHALRRDSHRSFLAQTHQMLRFLVPECACSTCRCRCAARKGQDRVSVRLRSRLSHLRSVSRASCPGAREPQARVRVKKRSTESLSQKRPRLSSCPPYSILAGRTPLSGSSDSSSSSSSYLLRHLCINYRVILGLRRAGSQPGNAARAAGSD